MQPLSSSSPRHIHLIAIALLLAVQIAPVFAAAEPGPRGPDILVATNVLAACPAVAMSPNGDFEVIWNNSSTESHPFPEGTLARHFDRQGRPTQAKEIRLDSIYNFETGYRHIVALPKAGYFVVWWEDHDHSHSATVGRFLDPAGQPRSPVRLLKRFAFPVALTLVGDSLLVAWKEEGSEGAVWARRFDFAGHALGKAMLLAKRERLGAVGLAPLADSFVAVWQRWTGTSWPIEARRFSLAGEPLSGVLRVADFPPGVGAGMQVSSDGNDRFAVAWGAQVRFFDTSGARGPATNPALSTGVWSALGLAMDRRGLTLVAWALLNPALSFDAAGRFLDSTGQPASEEIPLSQRSVDDFSGPSCPVAASSGDGNAWVVAWYREGTGVFARRVAFED